MIISDSFKLGSGSNMSSVVTTNRASEMWNNGADVNNQSVTQTKHYGHRQYPMMPHYYNYQNNFYSQNSDYSNITSADYAEKMYGSDRQSDNVVKSEPTNWQGYPANYMNGSSQANMEMITKWREMNYYAQQQHHENYTYDPRMTPLVNQNCLDTQGEDVRSLNSPGQCSLPDTSYGSPRSTSSNVKSSSPVDEDSPNLRALLTKPPTGKRQQYFVKSDKSFKQEMLQRIMYQTEVEDWEKTNETASEKECNLSQFHGGFEIEGQTSIKSKGAVGGAHAPLSSEGAASSADPTEPCQDVTRVEAGGDNADYAENKMAAAPDAHGFYPWMKGVGGKYYNFKKMINHDFF